METIQAYKVVYKRPWYQVTDATPSKTIICRSFNLDTYGILKISNFMEKIKDPDGTWYLNQYKDNVDAPEFMYIATEYTLEKINIQI